MKKWLPKNIRWLFLMAKKNKSNVFCFALSLLITTGCGKKVEKGEAIDSNAEQTFLEAEVIQLSTKNQKALYEFDRVADVYLPQSLTQTSGATLGETKVYFAYQDISEEFYCVYKNTLANLIQLQLENCYLPYDFDGDGQDDALNYRNGVEILQTFSQKMYITSDKIDVDATFEVKWY